MVKLSDLFLNSCIYRDSSSINEEYIEESKKLVSAMTAVWPEYEKLAEKFSYASEHIFRVHNTEIKAIFAAYDNLEKKSARSQDKKEWFEGYGYIDVYALYSILGNQDMYKDMIQKFKGDDLIEKVLRRFKYTRDKFFDHRVGSFRLDHSGSSNTRMDVYFYFYNKGGDKILDMLTLQPSRDFKVFLGILKKLK